MSATCRACQAVVAAGAKFCANCGAAVAASPAERRLLTVVFCDLVGSTALAELLDPEDMRDLLIRYQACCAEAVERAGGSVQQYLGDGVLIYFGYPQSHEDDARRAVQAALAIVKAVAALPAPAGAPAIAARAGIHSGLALVGEVGRGQHREQLAVGGTPNVAARVQAEAQPHQVVVSAATLELIEGYFETVDLGTFQLKGIKERIGLHHVVGTTAIERRIDVAAKRGLTPFVGQPGTRELVTARWKDAEAGGGHALLLTGEAGLGKSRHVQIVKAQAPRAVVMECFCAPDLQNSSLHPFTPTLADLFGFSDGDDAATRFAKIRTRAAQDGLQADEDLSLLASLVGVTPPAGHPPVLLSATRQYLRTLELVVALLTGRCREGPVLLVVEDLHWADPSTIEMLGQLVGTLADSRLLVMATARPEFTCPWSDRPGVTTLALTRLDADAAREMILTLTGGVPLPDDIVRGLVERGEGVPLYLEELTRAVLSSGFVVLEHNRLALQGSSPDLVIPATLQGSLMARLDRLQEGKPLAQLASVFGRSFSAEVLASVADLPATAFDAGLRRLLDDDIVRWDGEQYVFQHALVRDAAYESVPKDRRRQLHRGLAHALESHFAHTALARPELLAYHYGAAGDAERAAPLWLKAGQAALQRNALIEAAGLLRAAHAAVLATPESPARAEAELDVVLLLIAALINLQGYGAPEVEAMQMRAQALCDVVVDVTRRGLGLVSTWMFESTRASHAVALERATTILALADAAQHDDLQLEAHLAVGVSHFYLGGFDASVTHFERVIAQYRPDAHALHRFQFGNDPASISLSYLSVLYWMRGDIERAFATSREALALAAALRHPFSEMFALMVAGSLRLHARDLAGAAEVLEGCQALCQREGIPGVALALWGGCLRAELGDPAAPEALQLALDYSRIAGVRLVLPHVEGVLAEAHAARGDHAAAAAHMAACFDGIDATGERWVESEAHRRHARILERRGAPPEEVDASLARALDCARRLGAVSWAARVEEDIAAWQARRPAASSTAG